MSQVLQNILFKSRLILKKKIFSNLREHSCTLNIVNSSLVAILESTPVPWIFWNETLPVFLGYFIFDLIHSSQFPGIIETNHFSSSNLSCLSNFLMDNNKRWNVYKKPIIPNANKYTGTKLPTDLNPIWLKIAIIGDSDVGKTTLARRAFRHPGKYEQSFYFPLTTFRLVYIRSLLCLLNLRRNWPSWCREYWSWGWIYRYRCNNSLLCVRWPININ